MATNPIIVITGPPGVGKTTLVRVLVSQIQKASPSLSIKGFYTEDVRQAGIRTGFDVVSISGQRATLASVSSGSSANKKPLKVGRYFVDVPAFEAIALPQLQQDSRGTGTLLVIDEVGKMELLSRSFESAVARLLDTPRAATAPTPAAVPSLLLTIPVAGNRRIDLVERIRSHPHAIVVTLSKSNRNDQRLQDRIVSALCLS